VRIRLETAAIEGIFALAESGDLTLAWSFMLEYENSLNPDERRREGVDLLSHVCKETIRPSPEIIKLARRIIKRSRIRARDSVHVACAEAAGCDYFMTCDDSLVRTLSRTRPVLKLKVKPMNPVEFIRREGK